MNTELLRACESFIKNLNTLRSTFKWDGDALHLMGGAILTALDIEPDGDELDEYERIIRENTMIFSPLRGTLKTSMACNMAGSEDPEEYLDNVERAFSLIRITRGGRDDRYYLAAMTMASAVKDKEELLGLVDRTNDIYASMKSATGKLEDESGYPAAAIIASSDVEDVPAVISCAREIFEILSAEFGKGMPVENLSLLMALDRSTAEPVIRCTRLRDIIRCLSDVGISVRPGDELPVLGALSMLDISNADIAGFVSETDEYLRGQKGFGHFGCGRDIRHMYAALLVTIAYVHEIIAAQFAEGAILENAIRAQFAAMQTGTLMLASRLTGI